MEGWKGIRKISLKVESVKRIRSNEAKIVVGGEISNLTPNILLRAGPYELQWEVVDSPSSKLDEAIEQSFVTNDGVEIFVGEGRQTGQYVEYLLDLDPIRETDPNFQLEKDSFSQSFPGSEVWEPNFNIIDFKDEEGLLPIENRYYNRRTSSYIIETSREIKGNLLDPETGVIIPYEEIKQKKDEKWIILKEAAEVPEFINTGHSVIDIFMDMIAEAIKPEIIVRNYRGKKEYKIRVYRIRYDAGFLQVQEYPPHNKRIYPPRNTSQLNKQIKSVEKLLFSPLPALVPLLKLFQDAKKAQWPSVTASMDNIEWEFLRPVNGKLREGTEKQRKFVLKALNTPDFAILEGPPGSGKTTVITELIYQLIVKQNKKVLLSASTHVAIDNVLEKIIEKYGSAEEVFRVGIVPLRIGREENISDLILPFHLDQRKQNLKEKLTRRGILVPQGKEEDEFLEKLVVNSSNLVCGTTIGILAHPQFDIYDYTYPEYDYLIIDEASKTTFQQFLVPAIFAKKWILSGDIRQLTPYTTDLHVRISLEGLLDQSTQRAILLYFVFFFDIYGYKAKQDKSSESQPRFIVFERLRVIKELINYIMDVFSRNKGKPHPHMEAFLNTKVAIVTKNEYRLPQRNPFRENDNVKAFRIDSGKSSDTYQTLFKLYNYDLILVENLVLTTSKKTERLTLFDFPITHIPLSASDLGPDYSQFLSQHNYYYHLPNTPKPSLRVGRKKLSDPIDIRKHVLEEFQQSWAGQLSWRLKRRYELEKTAPKKKSYYNAAITALSSTRQNERIHQEIRRISQIYFPSILTAFQEGIYEFFRGGVNNVLTKGMEKTRLGERHELLEYQHRMHDDIASIPRDLFYKKKALQTSSAILLERERDWPSKNYDRYSGARFCWIHAEDQDYRNKNKEEAKIVIEELNRFIEYARSVPDKKWTVLLLTFYNKQRTYLGDVLRDKYPSVGRHARTHFHIHNVHVMIYTIDKVQGREADVVFLSLVRNYKLGFMDSPNRINVAITRARYLQVLVGNHDFFINSDSFEWNKIAKRLFDEGRVFVSKKGQLVRKTEIKKHEPYKTSKRKSSGSRARPRFAQQKQTGRRNASW